MRRRFARFGFALAVVVSLPGLASGQGDGLRLPALFADHLVVQRDKALAVWGWARPGATITVDFRGKRATTRTSGRGEWRLAMPPSHAGGPYMLTVSSGSDRIDVRDVLVGDVWVASGQSNMEFQLSQASNGSTEIASAHDSLLRQFKVPTSWANDPEQDLAGGSWTEADPRHAGAFTAVGYFFAKELRRSEKVPIGLINTTWGGSAIEAWLSRDANHLSAAQWAAVQQAGQARTDSARDALRARLGALPTSDEGLVGGRAVWADPALDDASWSSIHVPDYWEGQGYPGMDGVAWYRTTFELSDEEIRSGLTLSIVAVDDDDITWINGVEIGRTTGYNLERAYRVPASVLHAGRNVLAVRVTDGGGGGGINGAASLLFGDGHRRSLSGTWKFKVGAVSFQPDGQVINKIPTVLYNKMVNPILPFAIKGVIWYQGESNANNLDQARAYREQFASLIQSWRGAWSDGRDAFPFLWVQLPNFGQRDSVPPADEAWAAQRESMDAALSLSNTGRAITIDVGDADDIHPKDKLDPGVRLARVAQKVAYGENVVASGPTYRAFTVRGDTAVVEFANLVGGLTSKPAGDVQGFELAAADGKFVWAKARIVGDRVIVWSDRVHAPVVVRYAWANNPPATLYNRAGLPAVPFRSDARR